MSYTEDISEGTPRSLSEALVLYQYDINKKQSINVAQKKFHTLLRGLLYYNFQEWGGPIPHRQQPSETEIDAGWQFMQTIPLSRLKDAIKVQTSIFDQLGATTYCRQTYGFQLKQFLIWVELQNWCPYPVEPKPPSNRAPKKNHGHGAVGSKSVSGRISLPSYSLSENQTPLALQVELKDFYNFFTTAHQPERQGGPIKPGVAKNYIVYLRRILGWFYSTARPVYAKSGAIISYSSDEEIPTVPLDQLSLELLIPKTDSKLISLNAKPEVQAQKVAEYVDRWLCKFLNFLELDRKNKSHRSLYSAVAAVHALIRFQYHKNTKDSQYRDILVMQTVRTRLRIIISEKKQERVSDIEMQWLDLPEVWRQIVTPLREECTWRHKDGHLRSMKAIAHSFQLFILWGCLTFRPPRRQQEFRELKISLACSVKHPEGLKQGQFIHPLPMNRDEDKYHGYLFKAKDEIWYMHMTPESYKTGATYGHQNIEIPNPKLANGKSFYDYLEAFLYGYFRDFKGNWRSGGKLAETPSEEGKWHSLRMAFEPTHNHVFGQPEARKTFDHSAFCKIIRTSANRLTGQRLPPHLLRDIVATWFLNQEYTPEKITSLAYAMGHSERALREIYDRRSTQEKNRPIEEAISPLVQKSMI